MGKRRSLEEQLEALTALRGDPGTPEALAELMRGLQSKSSFVAAKAAQIVAEAGRREFLADLVAAFARFMDSGVDTDKGCKAKSAIAEALDKLGCEDEALFLRGVRHVQREPVWGGSVDTAAELRAISAAALVRLNHPDVMALLADLLVDAEAAARAGAARAIAYRGGDDGAALLRLKLRIGDDEPQVVQECLLGLLQLAPRQGLELSETMLRSEQGGNADAAALALGQSRLREAFELLRRWCERTVDETTRKVALTAIVLLRHDESLAYLLELIHTVPARQAVAVIQILAMYKHDPQLARRVRDAAAGRKDRVVVEAVHAAFGA